jgi:hypothetical protein
VEPAEVVVLLPLETVPLAAWLDATGAWATARTLATRVLAELLGSVTRTASPTATSRGTRALRENPVMACQPPEASRRMFGATEDTAAVLPA